jgi:molybdate transport system regulatory protein
MKTSARNHLAGTVSAVRAGVVNDEVELALPGGARVVAVVTRESSTALGLKPGVEAFALVKASSVIVATDLHDVRISARNQLRGKVASVTPGAVNAEVVLAIEGGATIAAIVTETSVRELGLAPGSDAVALFKASNVILGVRA